MGIKEILMGSLGLAVENKQEIEEKQSCEYQISAVCDTEEEIAMSRGVGIGIGGDDE